MAPFCRVYYSGYAAVRHLVRRRARMRAMLTGQPVLDAAAAETADRKCETSWEKVKLRKNSGRRRECTEENDQIRFHDYILIHQRSHKSVTTDEPTTYDNRAYVIFI